MKNAIVELSGSLAPKQDFSKKALMCRTGTFDGMNGQVTVTKEMLEGIAEVYNLERKNPQNENDYRPVLTDHVREVDRVKGRILPDLEVKPWTDPGTGDEEFGLFGTLRIDNEDAREKVTNGTYANLSISFDEDTFELFEISFVSIEAAKRSIILSNKISTGGKKMSMPTKLMSLSKKHTALAAQVKQSRAKRQVALSALVAKKTEVEKEITSLMKKTGEITLSIKASQLKAQFQEFVRQGKMNPAELKEIDFKELCALSESARKIVLSSYEKRPVSTDVLVFGQSSDRKVSLDMSPAATRERMELQRAGKGAALAEEMPEKEEKKDLAEEMPEKEEKKPFAMSEDEHAKHMQDMMECHQKLGECVEKIKSMGLDAEKISDDDKQDEKKETKEMADESESEDMGADDEAEKDEKSKSKEKGE
jgi:hypothetical protein